MIQLNTNININMKSEMSPIYKSNKRNKGIPLGIYTKGRRYIGTK